MKNSYGADLKLIVVGNTFTGKTSFVKRWTGNQYSDKYKATIVSEFGYKILTVDDMTFRIQLWDLAGQDRNQYITRLFCEDCQGALVLCEVKNPKSMEDAVTWKSDILAKTKLVNGKELPIILIQNKCDLLQENEGEEELKKFSEDNNFLAYFLTSAKTGKNVNESMDFLIKEIVNRLKSLAKESGNIMLQPKSNIKLDKDIEEKKGGCC